MFGISFSEIVLIAVVGLLVFGPKQIPHIATQVGKTILYVRTYINNLKTDMYNKIGVNEVIQVQDNLVNIYSDINNDINQNTSFDDSLYDTWHQDFIYFQPELDFNPQMELFDNEYKQ